MPYANILTGEIRIDLPSVMALEGSTITGATIEHWKQAGWRTVVSVEPPAAGYRATGYTVQPVDGTTCNLVLSGSVNIAAEVAAAVAATAAAQKLGAKNILDGCSEDTQRALRAFAELVLDRTNTLAGKVSGVPQVTWAQFLSAMKSKIDAQS